MVEIKLWYIVVCFHIVTLARGMINYDWNILVTGSSGVQVMTTVVDNSSNIYFGAYYLSQSVNISHPSGVVQRSLTSNGAQQGFIAKMDSNGSIVWLSQFFSDTNSVHDQLALTSDGGLVYSVSYRGKVTINDTTNSVFYSRNSLGQYDISINKVDSNGIWQWTSVISGVSQEQISDLRELQKQQIGVTFLYGSSPINLNDSSNQITQIVNGGGYDVGFWLMNSNGSNAWHASISSAADDFSTRIAQDSNGNIVFGSVVYGTTTYVRDNSDQIVASFSDNNDTDSLIACFNSSGVYKWSNTFFGSGSKQIRSFVFDKNNNLYLALIYTAPNASFNDSTGNTILSAQVELGKIHSLLIKLDSNGVYVQHSGINCTGSIVYAQNLYLSNDGNLLLRYQSQNNTGITIFDYTSQYTAPLFRPSLNGTGLLKLSTDLKVIYEITSDVYFPNFLYYFFDMNANIYLYGHSSLIQSTFYNTLNQSAYFLNSTGIRQGFIIKASQDQLNTTSITSGYVSPAPTYPSTTSDILTSKSPLSTIFTSPTGTVANSSISLSSFSSQQSKLFSTESIVTSSDPVITILNKTQQKSSEEPTFSSSSSDSMTDSIQLSGSSSLTLDSSLSFSFGYSSDNNSQLFSITTDKTDDNNLSSGLAAQEQLMPIIYGVIGAAFFIVLFALIVIFIRRKNRKPVKSSAIGETTGTVSIFDSGTTSTTAMTTLIGTNHILQIPAFLNLSFGTDFRKTKYLTSGGGGQIYFVQIINPSLMQIVGENQAVAKIVYLGSDSANQNLLDAFYQELSILYMFRDSNYFAKIYGYSENPHAILMKYYTLGSLKALIHGEVHQIPYNKRSLLIILSGIASGINEFQAKGFVHNDIKPDNVLLDQDSEGNSIPILTDFGISKLVDQQEKQISAFKLSKLKGVSIIYAAPEAIKRLRNPEYERQHVEGFILKKTDVFSLGIVILESLIRQRPY